MNMRCRNLSDVLMLLRVDRLPGTADDLRWYVTWIQEGIRIHGSPWVERHRELLVRQCEFLVTIRPAWSAPPMRAVKSAPFDEAPQSAGGCILATRAGDRGVSSQDEAAAF